MFESVSIDTFFLSLISILLAILIPVFKSYLNCVRKAILRIELLEYIALKKHPDIVKEYRSLKK